MFFVIINFLFLLITTTKKIIVVAIFVNFLRIFKVYNFAHFHVHDRGITENGTSWLLTSFRELQCCVSEKNIWEHAIVCVKIVAECKEYELLETVAIQDTQDRVFLFIRCLYPDETRPRNEKKTKEVG